MAKPPLTLEGLKTYSIEFLRALSVTPIPSLYGTTDGKAVGTHVEATFHTHLVKRFDYVVGSAALGIDFPALEVDLKVTSIKQPQSSCPFRSAAQKVYGLGYNILVFVYDKTDDPKERAALLNFHEAIFIQREQTADYQTTAGLLGILERGGNEEDIAAFLEERNLPLEEIGMRELASRILAEPPPQGVLTMSNALQWRLQYGRAITVAGTKPGVEKLLI